MNPNIISLALACAGLLIPTAAKEAAAPPITLIDLPGADVQPCDLAVGSDNNIYTVSPTNKTLLRINAVTNAVTIFALPPQQTENNIAPPIYDADQYKPCTVRADSSGNIYAIIGSTMVINKFDPQTETLTSFLPNHKTVSAWTDIAPGDKDIYMTLDESDYLFSSNYTDALKVYQPPQGSPGSETNPLGLFLASDTALWYTLPLAGGIGRLNPNNGSLTIYFLRKALRACQPAYIRVELDGILYFTCFENAAHVGRMIGGINMKTGKLSSFPTDGLPSVETLDGNGNIWYSTFAEDLLGTHNPKTKANKIYPLPPRGKSGNYPYRFLTIIGVQYLEKYNRVYFTQPQYNRVGYVALS